MLDEAFYLHLEASLREGRQDVAQQLWSPRHDIPQAAHKLEMVASLQPRTRHAVSTISRKDGNGHR